jgi:hypothetical protein
LKASLTIEGNVPDIPDEDTIPKKDRDQDGIDRLNNAIEPSIDKYVCDRGIVFSILLTHQILWRRIRGGDAGRTS